MKVLIGGVVAVALLGLFFMGSYNNLVRLEEEMNRAWAQVENVYQRRLDLIPNLVETVKGYAKHEKTIFEDVANARAALMGASSPHDKAAADNMLTGALKSLFAIAENYPALRATENFQELQQELSDTEDKVAYSRQFYNNVVMEFNTKIAMFPNVLLANALGFTTEEFYEATDEERKKVDVKFD